MILFFFLKLAQCLVQQLNKAELYDLKLHSPLDSEISIDSPFLIFLYYQKEDFVCPLCDEFKNSLAQLSIPVRTLNFAENVELGSRFLQHTFPAFIVRYKNQSYVIEPENTEDLENIIKNETWKTLKPTKKRMDVDSIFALAFGKVNKIIFRIVQGIQYLGTVIPEYCITVFILFVISFLIYSIVDVLRTENPKVKRD